VPAKVLPHPSSSTSGLWSLNCFVSAVVTTSHLRTDAFARSSTKKWSSWYPNGSLIVELRDASLFTPVRQVELRPKALAVEGAPRAKVRAELRDHFSDMHALQVQEDPKGADSEPYELLVPGGEFPPTFMPVGSEPRPSEISAAKRAARKVAYVSPAGVEPALAT
jgi:hypothetical protein